MSINPDEALAYIDFVVERHSIWMKRQEGLPAPWTEDPILAERKFTNVFRVLDPGSQFALGLVDEDGISPRDAIARAYLYRVTNLPDSWDALLGELGRYPLASDLGRELTALWMDLRASGVRVFSGAYVINQGIMVRGVDKLEVLSGFAARFFSEGSPDDLVPDFLYATTQRERHSILKRIPGINDFMALQILTDYGYSLFHEANEDEFVVGGPGSILGARFIDPDAKVVDTIWWAYHAIQDVGVRVELPDGCRYRYPSLMDAQNTLCEFSKYVRLRERPMKGKPYPAVHPGPQPRPRLPRHW